jgi:hypothetical protein
MYVRYGGRGPKMWRNRPGRIPDIILIMYLETEYVKVVEERLPFEVKEYIASI